MAEERRAAGSMEAPQADDGTARAAQTLAGSTANSPATPTDTCEFFATCAKGFEELLAGELASMGIGRVRALRGQVAFAGPLASGYRACLWSRIASRVVLVLAHIDAADSDALYESLRELPWENQLPLDATFAVDAHGTNENLRNTQFVALRAKDAICDRIQAKLGGRPSVDARRPDVSVVVRLRRERATCGIDLTGTPLFRRGTMRRQANDGLGVIRPDYAAALLAAGGWYRCCRHEAPVAVSMYSGPGTVLVEAAGMALDQAPGLIRTRWGFTRWLGHDADTWDALVSEAQERAKRGAARASKLVLIALDTRAGADAAARKALRASGLDARVSAPGDTAELAKALKHARPEAVLMTCDLSWLGPGEEAREVAALGLVGDAALGLPAGAAISAIAQGTGLDAALGLTPIEARDVLIGREAATLLRYVTGDSYDAEDATSERDEDKSTGVEPDTQEHPTSRATVTLKDGTKVPVLVAASDQFAARLAKVARLRAKWARREDVSCYRVYDADLPDYAVAIDLYQASATARGRDAGKRWVVVQEYAAPKSVDADLAHKRLLDVLAIVPPVLGVAPEDVTLRVRRRAKGGSQYANEGAAPASPGRSRNWLALAPGAHLVDEGGLAFEVNLAERLDTGLFLDHRDVRAELREMAKETKGSKRFLNLFAYTGTATCYAADGGAKHTTTVDLSRTYLDWAQRNMARNGFEGPEHEFVQADVVSWISEQRRTKNRWDLVFCDPPTFSNSKRMRDVFDVQASHAELLIGISRLLTADGVCLFSCNLRGFAPDVEKLARYGVTIEDVTAGTIPEDFSRNAKIHHCYLVHRMPRDEA